MYVCIVCMYVLPLSGVPSESGWEVERPCGHSAEFACKQLVQLLKQQEVKGHCSVTLEKPLRCGHMATATCRKFQDYEDGKATIKCTEKRVTECWNAQACQSRRLVVDCAETRKVCCDKAITWTCEKSIHSFSLKICKEGVPDECPSCSGDRLTAAMEETQRCMDDPSQPITGLRILSSLEKLIEEPSGSAGVASLYITLLASICPAPCSIAGDAPN